MDGRVFTGRMVRKQRKLNEMGRIILAKLTGVKTIDMTGGEITAIEYGGAVYAKVSELTEAKKGDIIRPECRSMDVTAGNFYVVTAVDSTSLDIVDDKDDPNGFYYRYGGISLFRKAESATASAPFAEMVMAKVDAVERKVAAIEAKLAPKLQPNPKTGDIVVITANTNGSQNEVGDIGVVGDSGENSKGQRQVHVTGRKDYSNWTKYSEMRLATPAEIAQYESAVAQAAKEAVFTKAGRKPNEYRKGDVVRITGEASHNLSEGDVGIITELSNGFYRATISGKRDSGNFVRHDQLEIVCFAENRADLAKGAC